MIDIQDKNYCPSLEEIGEYVNNPVFIQFCTDIKSNYNWNVKFRKGGKNLCTIYPKERFFSVLVVIGLKEKETVEVILQECTAELRDIYNQTKTGNGQKWLTIDLEDKDKMYADIFRLIDIRRR